MKCFICNGDEDVKIIKNNPMCINCRSKIASNDEIFKIKHIKKINSFADGIGVSIVAFILGFLYYILR